MPCSAASSGCMVRWLAPRLVSPPSEGELCIQELVAAALALRDHEQAVARGELPLEVRLQ